MAELVVEAARENLDRVTAFVNKQLERYGCPDGLTARIDLAVEEIYVNIAHYAYRPGRGEATIRCGVGGDPLQVTIEFLDEGTPYNPLEKEDPDVTLEAGRREAGGLGIYLVKHLADDIRYERKDGKNILTICKRL